MIDHGVYGAKTQSWRQANPRAALERLIAYKPGLGRDELLALFRDEIEGNADLLHTIVGYWFDNNLRSLVRSRHANRATTTQRRAMVLEGKEKVRAIIESKANGLFLESLMPNNKTLRESSFAECLACGGWLTLVGKQGEPDQIVGEHLSEERVRELFNAI